MLCLHVGSSGTSPTTSPDAPPEIPAVLFGAYGMYSAVDWLYSKVPVRFPDIRICLSEGGIGWVAGHHRPPRPLLPLPARLPADVARRRARRRARCCAATSGSARSTTTRAWSLRDRIGVDHILVGVRLPARRLVVARHAGDARAPAPRPGRPRRRRAPHHVAERVGAVPAPGSRRRCNGDRHDRRVSSRATRASVPTASRSSSSASGTTMTWREYDERSSRMAATLAARVRARRPRRAPAPRRTRRARGDARVREGGHRRGRDRLARRRARGRAPRRPHRRAHAAHRRTAGGAEPRRRAPDRRRRPLVPQLHVGHDRPAEDRDAQPGALVRVPRASRDRDRALHAPTTCSSARCPRRSASGCGPRTSRPTIVGAPCIVCERFDAEAVLAAIERYRVTVLAAVSTQFVMLLNSPAARRATTCRRCASCSPAARWCPTSAPASSRSAPARRCCSSTAATRPARCRPPRSTTRPRRRLRTAGRVIPEMHVRLLDPDTDADITATGGPACPRARARRSASATGTTTRPTSGSSPPTAGCAWATSRRSTPTATSPSSAAPPTSSSAAARTSAPRRSRTRSASHPAVALCAAVAMPDATFGERVCVFVELRAGHDALDARRAARAPRATRHRQGAVARAPRRARRAPPLVGRQGRERRAGRNALAH